MPRSCFGRRSASSEIACKSHHIPAETAGRLFSTLRGCKDPVPQRQGLEINLHIKPCLWPSFVCVKYSNDLRGFCVLNFCLFNLCKKGFNSERFEHFVSCRASSAPWEQRCIPEPIQQQEISQNIVSSNDYCTYAL